MCDSTRETPSAQPQQPGQLRSRSGRNFVAGVDQSIDPFLSLVERQNSEAVFDEFQANIEERV